MVNPVTYPYEPPVFDEIIACNRRQNDGNKIDGKVLKRFRLRNQVDRMHHQEELLPNVNAVRKPSYPFQWLSLKYSAPQPHRIGGLPYLRSLKELQPPVP